MTDNQKRWMYVICVIVIPFIIVHIFVDSPLPRLFAIIWLFVVLPLLIICLSLDPKQQVFPDKNRARKTTDPKILRRWTIVFKGIAFLLGIFILISFTMPTLYAVYSVYVRKTPLTVVTASVSDLSSAVLATGLYLYLNLSNNPAGGYMYWLPTTYSFGDSQYRFTILTGTNIILQVEPD